jgi:hypothetical protein
MRFGICKVVFVMLSIVNYKTQNPNPLKDLIYNFTIYIKIY